ncbi:Arginine biosynthesis bifunctional protein ArgJ [Methanosarcinaceae archaeon Ag5]|uniref:Glutamate N-acetyltransferase n=1 Tax=Methanolapillus africanus TaxID=3028297 RepID=A0AAE4MK63_9EURY|nr:Arginine biosynthesis bifunctional protein ArgJ [Methanosarcinaceae archaeon Ag5]
MIQQIEGGITAVSGVSAFGLKDGKKGLAIILAEGPAAGVFTRNKVIAAPLIVTKDKLGINGGYLSAVIANSGNANAYTGEQGLKDAKEMTRLLAEKIKVDDKFIAVASTGVIGRKMDMPWITSHIDPVLSSVSDEEEGSIGAMRAIMTTDLVPKVYACEVKTDAGTYRVAGIAKGSGMIEPNMGTMLGFVYTDAAVASGQLQKCLTAAVNKSFNMIVVDGDTSTNDMCLLTATGKTGVKIIDAAAVDSFQKALDHVLIELAKMIAKDGEGATKLVESTVIGAKTQNDANLAAKSIVRSPLVKTAIFGNDPNWGRIVAAAGYSGADFDQTKITLSISNGTKTADLVKNGEIIEKDPAVLDELKKIMSAKTIFIKIDLGAGSETATAWGCDLTYDYVKINADYTT